MRRLIARSVRHGEGRRGRGRRVERRDQRAGEAGEGEEDHGRIWGSGIDNWWFRVSWGGRMIVGWRMLK